MNDFSQTAVICHPQCDGAVRSLYPDARLFHFGEPESGFRFERIIVLADPSSEREGEWLAGFVGRKCKPGGDIVYLV